MTEPLMRDCPKCHGQGVVPYEKRKLGDGKPDPLDFKVHDLCEPCGGSGKVPLDPKTVQERPAPQEDLSF